MAQIMQEYRKSLLEESYSGISTNIPMATPEPETDINVKRGLSWAIGGILSGTVIAIGWFLYRLLSPVDGAASTAWEVADFIVVPVLAILYALLGAVIGGSIGMAIGIVFMGIAAIKDWRASQDEEEEEEEPRTHPRSRSIRGAY